MSVDRTARSLYWLLALVVLVISLGGSILAALYCVPEDGYRGGALGVVIALAAIWIGPDLGGGVLEMVDELDTDAARDAEEVRAGRKKASELQDLNPNQLSVRVRALYTATRLSALSERQSVAWLALATAIGALFSGFGDILAACAQDWLVAWNWMAPCAS